MGFRKKLTGDPLQRLQADLRRRKVLLRELRKCSIKLLAEKYVVSSATVRREDAALFGSHEADPPHVKLSDHMAVA